MTKYYADLNGDHFEIRDSENHDTIYSGSLSEIGIGENDPDYTNKLDDFIESELNIRPDEWEIG